MHKYFLMLLVLVILSCQSIIPIRPQPPYLEITNDETVETLKEKTGLLLDHIEDLNNYIDYLKTLKK